MPIPRPIWEMLFGGNAEPSDSSSSEEEQEGELPDTEDDKESGGGEVVKLLHTQHTIIEHLTKRCNNLKTATHFFEKSADLHKSINDKLEKDVKLFKTSSDLYKKQLGEAYIKITLLEEKLYKINNPGSINS